MNSQLKNPTTTVAESTSEIDRATVETMDRDSAQPIVAIEKKRKRKGQTAGPDADAKEPRLLGAITEEENNNEMNCNKNETEPALKKNQGAAPNTDSQNGGGQAVAAADLRRELLDVRNALQAVQADERAHPRMHQAAAGACKAISAMLAQTPVENSFGSILQSSCGWTELDPLELLGDARAERLGVAQWDYLYERFIVQVSTLEFVTWLLLFVPITFADMCDSMARYYAGDESDDQESPAESELDSDSATEEEDEDEASVDTRKFVAADGDPIECLSDESEEPEYVPRRRRRTQRKH